MIHVRNSLSSPEAIVLNYIQFSVAFLLETPSIYMATGTVRLQKKRILIILKDLFVYIFFLKKLELSYTK